MVIIFDRGAEPVDGYECLAMAVCLTEIRVEERRIILRLLEIALAGLFPYSNYMLVFH